MWRLATRVPSPHSTSRAFACLANMAEPETFNRFLARQPIPRDRRFFAYEILSRYGPENYCRPTAGSQVAVKAMDELFLMGVRTMTEGLPAFINCTREFLLNDI